MSAAQTVAAIDWAAVGTAIGSVGVLAGGIWAAWQRKKTTEAQTRADVAESNASATVADAQQTVYNLLKERVTTLEADMRSVRAELAEERSHSRKLVEHIWNLEGLMRDAGLTPPPFNPGKTT
ncbi:hypothetical protein [Lysobacter capsici]|uniref:hypothetical protein n=1 Tax=Lysobacter capsici TaxID=435897 RepID=UPI001C0055FF|nr:hypothetical protein [Lysobacter capsici]QWF19288.1 hypothetical protein KME82_11380 [Lysobacter capsici]